MNESSFSYNNCLTTTLAFSANVHLINSVLLVSYLLSSTSVWMNHPSQTSYIPSAWSCLFPFTCSQPLYKPIFLLRHHASHQHQLGLVCFLSRVLNLCMSESSFSDLNLCMSESSFSDTMHPINSVLSVSCHVFSTSAWVNHHSQTSVSVWVNDHSQTSCIPSSRSCWCPVACSQPLSERSFLLRHASHQVGLVGVLSRVLNLCMKQPFFSESEHKRTDDEPKQPGADRTQDQVQERHGQRPDVQFQVKSSKSTNW